MTNTANGLSNLLWINEVNFLTGLPAFVQKTNHMGSRVAFSIVRVVLLWLSLIAFPWTTGKWLFLGSSAMYLLEFFACFYRKSEMDSENVATCFVASHISLFNFIFDRPSRFAGSTLSAIVAIINLATIGYSICYLTYAIQFSAAWGCYGPKPRFKDLDGGYCSTYEGEGADTSGFGSLHCINAMSSLDPHALALCNGPQPINFSSFFHTTVTLLSISFAIYIGTIPAKVAHLVRVFEDEQVKKGR